MNIMTESEVREVVLKTIMEVAKKAEKLQIEQSYNDYGEAAKQLLNDTETNSSS